MLDTPQIVSTPMQLTAVIHLTVPREDIQHIMHPGLLELEAAVVAQDIAVTGPWFTHHLRRPAASFDFEICLPVATPVAAVGRVRAGQLPAATVARAVYRGPYEGLGVAWGELETWITAQGRASGPDLWERYVAGPEANPDPSTWCTELNRPLIDDPQPAHPVSQ